MHPMLENKSAQPSQLASSPRCGAKTRAGAACQRPAIRDRKRCRLHGGLSPGAPLGTKNGNYKNGYWTAAAIQERKWARDLVTTYATTGSEK
jgi:hypothetical protein